MSAPTRQLAAVPGVILREDRPSRLAFLVIDTAAELGWDDANAPALLNLGRAVTRGLAWEPDPSTEAALCRHRRSAVRWLAAYATPTGFMLVDNGDAIVLLPEQYGEHDAAAAGSAG